MKELLEKLDLKNPIVAIVAMVIIAITAIENIATKNNVPNE